MTMSVDGFVAGPNQSLKNPFGEGVEDRLHRWMFEEPDANAAEIEALTAAARAAADGAHVAMAGGAATVNQYLAAGLVDELRLHVAPLLLGAGERLIGGVGNVSLEPLQVRHTGLVTHLSYRVDSPERSS
jgi:dihydrofolate reductase